MSIRSPSSCSSYGSTESRGSPGTSSESQSIIVDSTINEDYFEGTMIPSSSSVSTISSFDVVLNQFQDLMHLKNVLVSKARQQGEIKNYIVDQQKETGITSDDNPCGRRLRKYDTEVYSPREKDEDTLGEKEEKTRKNNSDESMITIPCDQYESLVRQLEVERMEHAKTKTKCEEVTDRLDFSRGQIEILQKQLQREKGNFQKILGSVQKSNEVGDERKDRLETRVRELQEDNQQLAQRLRTKDSEIEKLLEALAKEKTSQDKRIIDMEVRRCQEDYISSFLTKTMSGRPHAKKGYPSKDHRKSKLSS